MNAPTLAELERRNLAQIAGRFPELEPQGLGSFGGDDQDARRGDALRLWDAGLA